MQNVKASYDCYANSHTCQAKTHTQTPCVVQTYAPGEAPGTGDTDGSPLFLCEDYSIGSPELCVCDRC